MFNYSYGRPSVPQEGYPYAGPSQYGGTSQRAVLALEGNIPGSSPIMSTLTVPQQPLGQGQSSGSGRPRRRDLNWDDHKASLKSMYLDNNKKLEDIMEFMQKEQDFTATWVIAVPNNFHGVSWLAKGQTIQREIQIVGLAEEFTIRQSYLDGRESEEEEASREQGHSVYFRGQAVEQREGRSKCQATKKAK
jgi:hypothetical protein